MPKYEVEGTGTSIFVKKDGQIFLGPFWTRDRAEEICDELERSSKHRVRPCMTCSTPFNSEGPHNRMCDHCRAKASNMGMVA